MSQDKKENPKNKRITNQSIDDIEVTYSKDQLFESKSHQKRQRHIKKRRAKKFSASIAVFVIIFILLAVLTVNIIQGKFVSKVKTSYIQHGAIELKHKGEVFFLREELVLKSKFEGVFVAQVNEGEKVSKGQIIGYIVSQGMEEVLEELKSVEKRIYAAEDKSLNLNEYSKDDIALIESELSRLSLSLVEISAKGSMGAYIEIKREIDNLMIEYNDLILEIDSKDSYIKSLQNKRKELKQKLEGKMKAIEASEAGIISFYMDDKSTFVSQLSSSSTAINDLKELKGKLSYMSNETVESGQNIARISPSVNYVLVIEKNKDYDYSLGKAIIIKSKEKGYEVTAKVIDLNEDLVFLETNKSIASAISSRYLDAEIILERQEGMKVPLRSLTDWDEAKVTARITLIRSGYIEYNYVNVLAHDGEYAIISDMNKFDDKSVRKVQYNDLYVVNYEKVAEGEFIS